MKLLTAIFGTGVYFYAVPILFQYGYNFYFGIPLNFIEPSIRDDIIFFFDFSRLVGDAAYNVSFWVWLLFIVLSLITWFLIAFRLIQGAPLIMLLLVIIVASLFGFYNFGNKIAEITTEFRVLTEGCLPAKENVTYIIPAFYQTTALITPIYSDTRKLTGGFIAKETNNLGCEIEKRSIGTITR